MTLPPPDWLLAAVRRAKAGQSTPVARLTRLQLQRLRLPTVCESARCPNRGECLAHRTATFLILGDICTRGCSFCAVTHGRPQPPAEDEPERLAEAVAGLGLAHVVITSVTRDDLADGGAGHFVQVARILRQRCAGVRVELLVPDFLGSDAALTTVLAAEPDILAHNLETVPRLYGTIRRGAEYARSLRLLRRAAEITPGVVTKSGIMLGLGERDDEIRAVLHDLRDAGCQMLTLGQYLAPSGEHAPVLRYVPPAEFAAWQAEAVALGFRSVAAGPLVRSSYQAPVFFDQMQ